LAAILPVSSQRCSHFTAELALTSKQPAASRRDAPAITASSRRIRKSREQGFGIDLPPKIESMPRDSLIRARLRIPDSTQPRYALSSSIDENEAYSNLYPLLVEHMPIEVLSSVVFNPPSISEYELLKKTISAYLHVMSIERSYVADLETLAQNVLLGDIFDNTANIGYHVDGVARIRIETEEQFRGWLAYFQRKLDA
jgi:hypothetical protein